MLLASAAHAADPEDELKAAAVLNFLRYSEFPAASAPAITVAVSGRPSLLKALERALAGKSVNKRTVRVAEAQGPEPGCPQVLYVAADKISDIQQALQGLHSCHPLTIGESGRFLEQGGAVNLMVVDGRMSFEVNLAVVDRAGVSISSTLLRYGQIRGRPPA
jgi:hypothetical protein